MRPAQTITFNPAGPFTYGDGPIALTATASSGLPVTLEIMSGPGALNGSMLTINGAGSIQVRASQPGNDSYHAAAPAFVSVTVSTATLVVTAQDTFKVEGEPKPTFTVTHATFVNGDMPASLGGALSFTTAATPSSPPGTYSVVPTGLTSANYSIRFVSGSLYIGACLATEALKPASVGSAIPIKIRQCGTRVPGLTLRAVAVKDAAGNLLPAQDAGNANADGFFRDAAAFMFNLKTTGLAPGGLSCSIR